MAARPLLLFLTACLCLLASAGSAAAAPGDLDRSFGHDGVVDLTGPVVVGQVVAGSGNTSYMLVEAEGRQFVVRNHADGSRDTSFGGAEGAQVPFVGMRSRGATLKVDNKGRPLVLWLDDEKIFVARFDSQGRLDGSFGVDGISGVDCECENADYVALLSAVDSQGRIVVYAGLEARGPKMGLPQGVTAWFLELDRLLSDGRLDPSFGSGGVLKSESGPTFSNLSLESDGTPVLASHYCCGLDPFAIWRFHTGAPIPQYDQLQGLPQNTFSGLTAMLPRPNGTLDLIGSLTLQGPASSHVKEGFVARVRSNGSLAPGFGNGGVKMIGPDFEAAALDAKGRIVGARAARKGLVVYRLLANGLPDRTFAGGGRVHVDGTQEGSGVELAVQPSGHLLLFHRGAMASREVEPSQPGLVRLLGGDGGAQCLGHRATIVGTRRSDELVGTPHRDVIAALAGNDTIHAGGGDDLICGGVGADRLVGGAGHDRLAGGPGRDSVFP